MRVSFLANLPRNRQTALAAVQPLLPFDPHKFAMMYHDTYGRFQPSPKVTAFLAVKQETSDQLSVRQFSYAEQVRHARFAVQKEGVLPFHIPGVVRLDKLAAFRNAAGETMITGYYKAVPFRGRPLCTITVEKRKSSENVTFYAMSPYSPQEQDAVTIPTFSSQRNEDRLSPLQDYFTLKGSVVIDSGYFKMREAMKRNPDQREVMGGPASGEYKRCMMFYGTHFSLEAQRLFKESTEVMHPATIRSLEKKGVTVSPDAKRNTALHASLLQEWLHLIGFRLSPMYFNPQTRKNLAAGRAVHNTEMILVESMAKEIATVPGSVSELSGEFQLLPFTQVIRKGELSVRSQVESGVTVTIDQKFDALVRDPKDLRISDIPGLFGMTKFLLEEKKPVGEAKVKVIPTEPVVVPEASVSIGSVIPTHSFFANTRRLSLPESRSSSSTCVI